MRRRFSRSCCKKVRTSTVFDRSGITPLHYAARHLNVEQVQLLLDQKADPTIVDVYGNSALHFAAVAASTWRPDASEKGRGNGFQTHSMCEICGSRHSNAGKCKLKSLSVEIKEKLEKTVIQGPRTEIVDVPSSRGYVIRINGFV